jgi:hypothetical protein
MLLIAAKCLFTHACGKRLVNTNPCHGIMLTALLGERPPIRKRLMLTKAELHVLLNAKMRRENALAVRIPYFDERREALIKWAGFLMACASGGNVVLFSGVEAALA